MTEKFGGILASANLGLPSTGAALDISPAQAPQRPPDQAMYWPLGAPRVYAATRRKRKSSTPEFDEEDSEDVEEKDTNILGLRVARNGHLFVTITKTALTVWQTSVRRDRRSNDRF